MGLVFLLVGCGPEDPAPCGGPGTICRVMGTGNADFNGDGRPATETALHLPTAARIGPDGLVYVMDFNNYRLRCLFGNGLVDTIAGSGVHAYAETGAAALASPLENPIDFDFLPDGRPVFVSLHDPRVLAIAPDGTLEVIAGNGEEGDTGDGGAALEASFVELGAITVAGDGSIYVSDQEANRVRRIAPDGTIATVAGIGEKGASGDGGPATEAALFHPQGLALDGEGNLYVADTFNHRIRRIGLDGTITTIAGTGSPGLSGDGGPAAEAELNWPGGIDVAPDGSLYVADTFNHRVRRIDLDGTIATVAGTTAGHSGDGGPATAAALRGPWLVDATADALHIADMQNQVVRLVYLR
jgi:hypothetical protein